MQNFKANSAPQVTEQTHRIPFSVSGLAPQKV